MNKTYITPLQLTLLIILNRSVTTLLILPVVTSADAKQDAWIASLINIFIGLAFAWLLLRLVSRFPNETIVEYAPKILGKWLGTLAILAMIFFYFFTFVLSLRKFSEFVVNSAMPETPIEIFIITLALAILYGVYTGLENIARANAFVIIVVFISLFTSMISVLPQMKFGYLLPILDNPWTEIIKAGINSASWFGEMSILLILYPNINKPKEVHRLLYGSVIFTSLIVTLLAISIISVLGPIEASKQTYPYYSVVKMISLGDIIERVESTNMAVWTAALYLKGCIFLYCALQGLTQLLGFKESKPLASPLSLLGIILSILLFHNFAELRTFLSFKSWVPFIIIFTVIIPISLLLVSLIKGTTPREEA